MNDKSRHVARRRLIVHCVAVTLVDPDVLSLPDRFELDREIGRGGMAVVYRAHDRHLQRFVAIKVLFADLSNTIDAERFEREIALMARLVHPGIVALFDSGKSGGRLYYVMPFVAAETLRTRLTRVQRVLWTDAATLGADIAEALAYAHGMGIVHRDVKPENVFAVGGRAVLTDFGIARMLDERPIDERQLTTSGMVVGMPSRTNSAKARRMVAKASARVGRWTMSLPIRES